ncbi:MAG: cytochrome C biogenesis protein [Flammeovirgaceae bacterium]|nr:cytochrome C biogenesis protein [Flammeovirgaceae bacterium]
MDTIGDIGHFLLISSFVLSFVSLLGFLYHESSNYQESWFKFASTSFYLHGITTLLAISLIYYLILNNLFQYYYAFQHSSIELPLYFKISSFWEGQEGSFLLWVFWNIFLGIIFINKKVSKWNTSVLIIISLTQLFLTSMVLGIIIFDFKIGSSPFIMLRDAVSAPIFQLNPDFIPENGTGLNPLLQNYWMVIHPPTLFLGFSICLIPFAYAISSLRLSDFRGWIIPAKKWLVYSIIILGIGIMMGAYWAYETLNFGGYWNWDPVENAVYVPWLFLVASLHSIILAQKNKNYITTSLILSILSFILILYSTFLTRSGILGDSSVHSFTDLGLSGQLLIYLFSFLTLGTAYLTKRWSVLPNSKNKIENYTPEFWLLLGVFTLLLMSFQVIFPTSIPVISSIIEMFGGISNMAPPVEKELFYSNAQIWFASLIAVLSGIAQILWWKSKKSKNKIAMFFRPLMLTMVISSLIIVVYPIKQISYMILISSSFFSIFSNGSILLHFFRKQQLVSSASVSHIGVAIMFIGILFSSGYSSIISKNYTGLVWNSEFPDEVNQDNMLIFVNEKRKVGEYDVEYLGKRKKIKNFDFFVNENYLEYIPIINKYVLKKDIEINGYKLLENDTVEIDNNEITYFDLKFELTKKSFDIRKQDFNLFPKVQTDSNSDMIVFSPDVKTHLLEDLYVHVRTYPDPDQEIKWSEKDSMYVKINETFFLNDYVSSIQKIKAKKDSLFSNRFVAEAQIKILSNNQEYIAKPIYIIEDNKVGLVPDIVDDLGIKVYLSEINPNDELFKISFQTTQKNWVIIEAVQKPFINLFWIGFFILILGLFLSFRKKQIASIS